MDSFGQLSKQRVMGPKGQLIKNGPLYRRSLSFKELDVNPEIPTRVTWTSKEKFFERHIRFNFYEESGQILSHSEHGRELRGVFLDKVCIERDCANRFPVTREFYPILLKLLENKTNWGSEFSFRGLADFTPFVMEWTEQVLKDYEQTLRQARIYGLVAVSQFPYTYDIEVWRAFCELWSPLTNTLHHASGEMGISLNDLKQIGGLPILGEPYEEFLPPNEHLLDESKYPTTVLELLQIHAALCQHHDAEEISWWKWLTHFYRGKLVNVAYRESFENKRPKKKDFQNIPQVDASKLLPLHVSHKGKLAAFLAFLLSRFVLPHGGKVVRPQTFVMACLMAEGTTVSLAPTVLGHICHGLGEMATHELAPGSANPSFGIHFVVGWLGEYFSCLYDRRADDDSHERFPLLARYAGIRPNIMSIHNARSIFRHIRYLSHRAVTFGDETKESDHLDLDTLSDVDFERLLSLRSCVLPVRVGNSLILEPYYPNRFARHFGLVQGVPCNNLKFSFSQRSQRSLKDIALSYARMFIRNTSAKFHIPRSYDPGTCTLGYCRWWVRVSTPCAGQSMTRVQSTLTKMKVILRNPAYVISDIKSVSKVFRGPVKLSDLASSSSNETSPDLAGEPTYSVHASKRPVRERSPSDDVHFKRAKYVNKDKTSDSSSEEKVDYDDEATLAPFFDFDSAAFVESEPPAFENNPNNNAIIVVSEPQPSETEQGAFDVTPLEIVPATLHSLLSFPMDDWVRESIKNGVNSVMKQILSLKSPHELIIARPRVSQSIEALQAMAAVNNVDLSTFVSQATEVFDIAEALTAIAGIVDVSRVEQLLIDFARRRSDLESNHAEFPQLAQESELSTLKEQVRRVETDLSNKKANLEAKNAILQSSIQKCEHDLQQLQAELDRAGQAKFEELNVRKSRLQDLLSSLSVFAPPLC